MAAAAASTSHQSYGSTFAPGARTAPPPLPASAAASAASSARLRPSSTQPLSTPAPAAATAPDILRYGTRVGIRSCREQRYIAAFQKEGGFDLDISGFHPFRQGDVANRAADCPSEWLLLHYSSRQHRGPVRIGDEVCFAKELTVAPGDESKDKYAYLALGATAEGSSMAPVVEVRESQELTRWTIGAAADSSSSSTTTSASAAASASSGGLLRSATPIVIRGKYSECLAVGKPLVMAGKGPATSTKFLTPSRLSGFQLACRGRDLKLPELHFRLVKAGVPFEVEPRRLSGWLPSYEGLKSDPTTDLGSMSLKEQELSLLEDVLFCMLGADGAFLRQVDLTTTGEGLHCEGLTDVKYQIQAPDDADPSLLQFMKQVLPLCECHATVQQFVVKQGQFEFGMVNHALCAALQELLKEFTVRVGQFETSLRNGRLSLSQLWYHIQPSIDTFALLKRVCNQVYGLIGGSVLHGIEEVMTRSSLTAAQDLCEHLLQQASIPYFDMISKWIYDGHLDDPYGEFFVSENARVRDERTGGPAADFWQRHFTLEERVVPGFIVSRREKILHAGKYLHVYYSSGPTTPLPETNRAHFQFSRKRNDFVEAIDAAYTRAASALVALFMRPTPDGLDLPGRLRSMRSFFFLGKADWFGQLLDTASTELESPATDVPLARFEGLLDLAIRTSSVASDPYFDDISCVMHNFRIEDACHRMTKGHTLPSEDQDEAKAAATSSSSLRGRPSSTLSAPSTSTAADNTCVKCFSLKYRTSWPLSIVFSKTMLLKYQVIFRHLLYCRYVERKLVEVWVHHQHTKEFDQVRASFSHSYSLRQRMLHFCRDYIYYVTIEVLEPKSHQFLESLKNMTSIDEVLRSHEQFLDTCMRELLLTGRDNLYRHLSKVLSTCLMFAWKLPRSARGLDEEDTQQAPDYSDPSRETGETRMERAKQKSQAVLSLLSQKQYSKTIGKFKDIFESQLQGFLRQIQQESSTRYEHFLSNLATRLDYNGYYTSSLSATASMGAFTSIPPSLAVSQQPSRASSPGRG